MGAKDGRKANGDSPTRLRATIRCSATAYLAGYGGDAPTLDWRQEEIAYFEGFIEGYEAGLLQAQEILKSEPGPAPRPQTWQSNAKEEEGGEET